MQKLTVAFMAAGLFAIHSTAFAFSESKTPSAPPSTAKATLNTSLTFDTAYAITAPSAGAGFAVAKHGVVQKGDQLGIEVSKPVPPGPGPLAGLSPGGSETDFSIIYATPLAPKTIGVVSLAARNDADNLPGQHDVAGMVRVKHSF